MSKTLSLLGIITFSAIGAYIDSFLNELVQSGLYVSDVANINNIVYINAKRTDYLKISRIAKKNGVKLKINKRKGLYFKLKRLKNHTGLLVGMVLSAFIFLILQHFILDIKIYGVDKITKDLIIETIYESGIHIGCISADIDTEYTELLLKNRLKDIGWVNIHVNGNTLDIEVYEGENIKKPYIPLNSPCNIIADRDGVIIETEVYSGTLVYPVGSGVAKGNVIVSGIVNDGANNIILSHANAKIIAEFNQTVEIRQNYDTIEKNKVSEEIEKEIMLFGFTFPLTKNVLQNEDKICEEEIKIYELLGIKLPWKMKTNTYTTYENINVKRTSEDVLRLLEQNFDMHCNNFFNDYEIVDVTKKIQSDSLGMTLTADVKLRGNIAKQQELYTKSDEYM